MKATLVNQAKDCFHLFAAVQTVPASGKSREGEHGLVFRNGGTADPEADLRIADPAQMAAPESSTGHANQVPFPTGPDPF